MEDPDTIMPSETEFPVPPTYEKADEIQEFDASGQLVTTVTVLRGSLVQHVGYSYGDSSLLPPDYLVKYPESRVYVSIPTRSHSWAKSFMEIFLPAGYPNSVTEDYMEYQIYDSLQAFSSSIAGLIASRAVLEGVGVGDPTASPTTALLLSVLQDSTGRIATILFAARLGLSLEPECKRWRLVADIFNDAAMILDCLSPAFPKPLRVSLLSASAALRALCGVAAGSAKASLSAHFAKSGNLGELNAKDSSQETIISLLGMLVGTALIPYLTTPLQTWTSLLLLLTIHLTTNYFAVRAVSMRTLNRQRASLLLRPLLSPPISPAPLPALPPNPIATPLQISQQETVIHLDPSSLHDPHTAHASFVSLPTVLSHASRGLNPIRPHILLSIFAAESYILYFDRYTRHAFIALKSSATPSTALRTWFCAMECAHMDDGAWAGGWSGGHAWEPYRGGKEGTDSAALAGCVKRVARVWPVIEAGLKEEGWDVGTNALETRTGTRFSVVGGEEAGKWEWWQKWVVEEREARQTESTSKTKGKEVKKDVMPSPNPPLPPWPSIFGAFGRKSKKEENMVLVQSPIKEIASEAPSEAAAASTTPPASEAGSHTSRPKHRLRKWLSSTFLETHAPRGREDRDSDASSRNERPSTDNPSHDVLSEKAALEDAAATHKPSSSILSEKAALAAAAATDRPSSSSILSEKAALQAAEAAEVAALAAAATAATAAPNIASSSSEPPPPPYSELLTEKAADKEGESSGKSE
ncbi:hypothetical protein VE02_07450 [Pseudogymnoascus sp. 03VT05]|nr:hypothetical protein VE02_07450 [Pseudogymnoascus sp. 03VT05]